MKSLNKALENILLTCISSLIACNCLANNLPEGFVDIKTIDPSIKIFAVNATDLNIMGRPLEGYNVSDKIIMTKKMALRLKKVQDELKEKGLSLLIYDAYRPQMAVDDVVQWGKDPSDQKMKKYIYPDIQKEKIFGTGYMAKRSSHSRGSAVDLTIMSLNKNVNSGKFIERKLPSGKLIPNFDDGSIDMGSSAGFFDKISWTENKDISLKGQKNRKFLKELMERHGFKNYQKEWWHYNLKDEPFPKTYFNFPIQ